MGCVDCGGAGSPIDLAGRVPLARCSSCDLVFQVGWEDVYGAELYEYYATRLDWPAERVHKPLNLERMGDVLDGLETRVRGRRLLDVGCGDGTAVRAAVERGWDASGIELSAPAVELCRRFGLDCSTTDVFDRSLDDERYDVIVMIELLEHVPEPGRFLARAGQLLAPGGILYLTTPNFGSLSRRVLGGDWPVIHPEHLSYFQTGTLRALATGAGLSVDRLISVNVSTTTLRRLVRRPAAAGPAPVGAGDGGGAGEDDGAHAGRGAGAAKNEQQAVRLRIEGSPVLRIAKASANRALAATRSGDKLKAWLRAAS